MIALFIFCMIVSAPIALVIAINHLIEEEKRKAQSSQGKENGREIR